jgi:hypothetical protein
VSLRACRTFHVSHVLLTLSSVNLPTFVMETCAVFCEVIKVSK